MSLKLSLHTQKEAPNDNLVILIHGLGSPNSTWIYEGVSWIDLFLSDNTFKNIDIAEITYDTSHLTNGLLALMGIEKIKIGRFRSITVGKGPCTNIEILARELKREIDSKKIKQYKNVVLVGHSMGGLVSIRYILEEIENNLFHNVKGMISLATPYNGSSFALYSKLIKSINRHAQIPSLEPNSRFLDETMRLWKKHLNEINVEFKFFFGTEDNIVSENSAIPHIVSSKWIGGVPLPGDHSSILNVSNHSSTSYIHVSEAIKEILEREIILKKKIIDEKRKLTTAKSITRLKANGLTKEQALYLLEKKHYNFEYLKPTDEKRLTVIVGEFGLGKSFATERIYLDLLNKADNDFDFPIPISVNAAQLDNDVQSHLEKIKVDESKENWIIVDGMDEVAISMASNILENIRIAIERWDNLRVILTSRPLSIFNEIAEKVYMKNLSEKEALDIVNFINCKEEINHFFNFPTDVKVVIQRPIFAILLGLYLNNKNNLIPTTSGELLSYLIENALRNVNIHELHIEQLLMNLAIKSTCKGNIPVKKSEIGDIDEITNLLDSGIIIEENGYLSFILPILNQWFAAKALSKNLININQIIENRNLDYWKYPLIILITVFKENQIDSILIKIVEKDPGFASILIEESIKKWGIDNDFTSLSLQECAEKIRMTMSTWIKPLNILANVIAPVDNNRNILPIGISNSDEWLHVSWYRGIKELAEVNILNRNRNENDWPTSRGARPGDRSSWYWRWTLEELRDNLTKLIKNKSLPICAEIIYKELMWVTTLKIVQKNSLCIDSVSLDEIKTKLQKEYQYIKEIKVDKKYVPMTMYMEYILNLETKGIEVVECPLPVADVIAPKDYWVWSFYSDERLYSRTIKIYDEVIRGYKEIVEVLFPVLKNRLRKYKMYPFILKGEFKKPNNDGIRAFGPGLKWHLEPLPSEYTEFVLDIKASNIDSDYFNYNHFYEIDKKIKKYRFDDCAWLGASLTDQVLDIFGDTPITDTIYKWLEEDLKLINWIG